MELTARLPEWTVSAAAGGRGEASLRGRLGRLFSDEGGATIVEHAIMVCVIALVIVSLAGSRLTPRSVVQSAAYLVEAAFSGGDEAAATASEPSTRP